MKGSSNNKSRVAIEKLETLYNSFLDEGSFKAYLSFASRFHKYSWGNIALIHAQKKDATFVAGFNAWKAMGRSVKKGEKGIAILAPYYSQGKNEDGEKDGAPRLRGFGTKYVFDVSQTEGEGEIPTLPIRVLGETADDNALFIFDILQQALTADGVEVSYAPLYGPKGVCGKGYIKIEQKYAQTVQATKTLVHEAAHHYAEHVHGFTSRDDAEMVAESVAYLVCDAYGIDTGEYSFGYLASWGEGEKAALKRNLQAIQKIGDDLLGKLEGQEVVQ